MILFRSNISSYKIWLLLLIIWFSFCKNSEDIGFSEPTFIDGGYPLNVREDKNVLYFTTVPYRNSLELAYDFYPLLQYLSEKIGKKVVFIPLDQYYKVYHLVGKGKIHIALIDPFSYFKKKEKYQLEFLAKPVYNKKKPNYSFIVTRNDKTIKEISNQTIDTLSISFDNPDSSMGYIVPLNYLKKRGININHFKKITFASNFENTVQSVLSGNYDLGCIDSITYEKYKTTAIGLKVLYRSPEFEHFPIVVQKDLDHSLKQKIKRALLELNLESHKEILSSINKDLLGFVVAREEEYQRYRNP